MEKMKPCPFCGSENIGVKDEVLDRVMGNDCPCSAVRRVWGYCRNCGCEGRKHTGDFVYDDEIIAAATENWNIRIPINRAVVAMQSAKHELIDDYGFNGGIEYGLKAIREICEGGSEDE